MYINFLKMVEIILWFVFVHKFHLFLKCVYICWDTLYFKLLIQICSQNIIFVLIPPSLQSFLDIDTEKTKVQ